MRRPSWLLLAFLAVGSAGAGGWWYYQTRPDRRLARGLEAARRGDWEQAESLAASLEAAGAPTHATLLRAETLFRRARLYLDHNEKSGAVPLLHGVLKELGKQDMGSLRPEAAALAGQSLYYLGRPRRAEQALLYALSERPNHADAHRTLAAVYFDQGALDRALEHLKEVARLDPQDGKPHRLRGLIHKDMERYAEAATAYEEALRRTLPASFRVEAQIERADVLAKQNKFSAALKLLDQAAEAGERELPTVLRAECLAGQGDTRQLRTYLEKALQLHPGSARLLLVQGQLWAEEGQLEEAVAVLQRAVAITLTDGACREQITCRYHLARVLRRLGRDAAAKEQDRLGEATRALVLKMNRLSHQASARPWDASVRLQLAATCRQLKLPALEEMWREAAAACPQPSLPRP